LEWAENLYKKDMELDPTNPLPFLRIALVNMARANAETDPEEQKFYIGEAIKNYDLAIGKKQDLAPAYYGKAVADEKLNNMNDAIEQLKKANLIDGANLDYRFELGRLFFNRGITQPDLSQTASAQITENAINPDGSPAGEQGAEVSVSPSAPVNGVMSSNEDLNTAEQLFLSILAANNNHANARYSLAMLYQKLGEKDKAEVMVKSLLEIIPDEATKDAVRQQFPGLY
jgi:tetratricopeptide (TPR) repeat protein